VGTSVPTCKGWSVDILLSLQMLDSGIDGAIAKPFKMSELLTKIRTLLE
jgi:DNA-binding response OmpR family regulator